VKTWRNFSCQTVGKQWILLSLIDWVSYADKVGKCSILGIHASINTRNPESEKRQSEKFKATDVERSHLFHFRHKENKRKRE